MSLKGRTKFAVAGIHPLLDLTRNHLIRHGLALVPWDENPDFCLIGAEIGKTAHMPLAQLELQQMQVESTGAPVLLLSSSAVYHPGIWPTKKALAEEEAGFPLRGASSRCLYASAAERAFSSITRTVVVRPFNVYGPRVESGVIRSFTVEAKRGQPLFVHGRGYQTRTFLHEDDFLRGIAAVLPALRMDMPLVYNIGSPGGRKNEISIAGLASLVHSTFGTNSGICFGEVDEEPFVAWKSPNMSRLLSLGWRPIRSLQAGILDARG